MNLVALSGSLRKASFNTGLLRYAAAHAADSSSIDLADISDLPLFSEDLEAAGSVGPAERLRSAVSEADGLLIASPEYNYGMTGVLKNAIDWLSRPYPQDRPTGDEAPPSGHIYTIPPSPLTGKPVGIMGASAGIGGTIRSQLQLRQSLQINSALPLAQPEVFVSFGYAGKFDPATGDLIDAETGAYVTNLVESLIAWIPVAKLPQKG